MLIFTLILQVYIVTGGYDTGLVASTETLVKDGGSEWQLVASLPTARDGVRGVALNNGRFIITGECWTMAMLYHYNLNS